MKKPKITILDLGYGNFKSLINAFDYLDIKTYVTNNKKKNIYQRHVMFAWGWGL